MPACRGARPIRAGPQLDPRLGMHDANPIVLPCSGPHVADPVRLADPAGSVSSRSLHVCLVGRLLRRPRCNRRNSSRSSPGAKVVRDRSHSRPVGQRRARYVSTIRFGTGTFSKQASTTSSTTIRCRRRDWLRTRRPAVAGSGCSVNTSSSVLRSSLRTASTIHRDYHTNSPPGLPLMSDYRLETDSMGPIRVPADRYYGAQTARSLIHFAIGADTMPRPVIRAFGVLKKAAALVNRDLGLFKQKPTDKLPVEQKVELIVRAADEVIAGQARRPLPAARLADRQRHPDQHERQRGHLQPRHRARRRRAGEQGPRPPQRRREHVAVVQRHLPDGDAHRRGGGTRPPAHPRACSALRDTFAAKAKEFEAIVKIGRTHLMDAVPLTLGQEFSGYVAQLDYGLKAVKRSLPMLYELALGGTAVGTGLNAHPEFAERVGEEDRRAHRPAVRHRAEQVPGAGRARAARRSPAGRSRPSPRRS